MWSRMNSHGMAWIYVFNSSLHISSAHVDPPAEPDRRGIISDASCSFSLGDNGAESFRRNTYLLEFVSHNSSAQRYQVFLAADSLNTISWPKADAVDSDEDVGIVDEVDEDLGGLGRRTRRRSGEYCSLPLSLGSISLLAVRCGRIMTSEGEISGRSRNPCLPNSLRFRLYIPCHARLLLSVPYHTASIDQRLADTRSLVGSPSPSSADS